MRDIAILGESKLARTLGNRYMGRGINVIFGVKNDFEITDIEWKIYNKLSDKVLPYQEAIEKADVIFICCENDCLKTVCQLLQQAENQDKIIVDCTNGVYTSGLESNTSAIKKLLGGKNLFKAFNNLGLDYPNSDPLGIIQETYYCGDNNEHKQKLKKWIELAGFKAIDAGEFENATLLEAFYHLKMKISNQQQQSSNCHFKLISV
ncbi:NAD(P)-binding domain-containing protein [Cyclobacterium sp.]|uniref:NADPH-dependent F420 reductase n=1 Tax=Cyclobacterium sp. TaxID=1966343 RepID=UPI0019942B37|nr:NAD(P)-binding domain-containing protein [Cyclobacterium sp.]MBD3628040.1 NAD(P)-binding domain-containing protein [Cyclobacterium sp.]